jgi:hypothetical protein
MLRFLLMLWLCMVAILPAQAGNVPAEVLSSMPKGAISLQWRQINTNEATGPLWLHLYCIPKGYAAEFPDPDIKRSGPVKREHITSGPSLKTSPFWLDIFRPRATKANTKSKGWQRLNSVRFEQSKDLQEIVLRWLQPKTRSGPVLALHFGYTHWHEWVVLTFPRGWTQQTYVQTFLWGGEGETGVLQRFDRTDAKGRLVIAETEINGEKKQTYLYRWNGFEWQDPAQKYFLIGASTKSRSEAEAVFARHGFGEVLWSNHYPRLRAGYYLWVAVRFRSLDEATQRQRALKQNKISTYVQRVH